MEVKKLDVCRKCLKSIPEEEQSIEISNFLMKGKYHLECYANNKKNIKRLTIVSYSIIAVVFFLILGLFLGILFGVILPKIH